MWYVYIMFYEKREHRHAAARRGAPRRAGDKSLFPYRESAWHCSGREQCRRRGPPWGAAAARVQFWYFVYFVICIGSFGVLDV